MAMTACYSNYDMSLSGSQSMTHQHQSHHVSSIQQSNRAATLLAVHQQSQQSPQQSQQQQPPQKDYSIPLHVDCSVEYELPNQAKPPVGGRIEPLLMIHPCYFRKMESQRRSPFINNMPNSSRSSNITNSQSNVVVSSTASSTVAPSTHIMSSSSSSNRRSNVIGVTNSNIANAAAAKNQSNTHMMSNPNVISSHQQNHMQTQHMNHHQQQSLQQQNHHQNIQQHHIDEYVQRQMVQISQQAQYPLGQQQPQQQSNSQYNLPTPQLQQQQHQMQTNGNWDRYLNVPNTSMLGKVNIPNQNAYKKSGKRHLSATCANSYSTSHLEGALPNGITRGWDEKTAMAAIPRDYQSGPESIPPTLQQHHQQMTKTNSGNNGNMYRGGSSSQQTVLMSGKRDRDPMLSGGCIYSNSNTSSSNLTTDISNLATSGLWEPIQKSPMAAIPNNTYQAGPDSIPNNNNTNSNVKASSNNGMTHRQPSGTTVIHHSLYNQQQQQQQQHIHQSDKLINNTPSTNSNVITVKYRQYRNAHRMHPYMLNNSMTAPTVNNALSYFPHLNGPFPQIQQVSCYNV